MNTGTSYADLFYSESDNNISTLEDNVKENPSSAIARFLLLYHYKKNNDSAFENFLNQSSLYFNNSYWLQHQLSQAHEESVVENISTNNSEHFAVTFPEDKNELPGENNFQADEKTAPIESVEISNDLQTENTESDFAEANNEVETDNNSFELNDENKEPTESVEINNGLQTEENKEDIISTDAHPEVVEETNDFIEPEIAIKEEVFAFEPKEDLLQTDQENNDAPFEKINEDPLAFEPKEENENQQSIELIENDFQSEENKEDVAAESTEEVLDKFEQPCAQIADNSNEDIIAFEPLHTIDYFASQGIKIKEEALTDDKLGQQVKSFTAWLKSMKKLHPGKLPEQNEVIERIIQSSAEESNADAEVLTEAMAEVLIKQNKQEKAIEMYQKLSLLNPSKSTYFAAKIESLKTN